MSQVQEESAFVTALSTVGLVFGLVGVLGSFIPCLGAFAIYVGVPAALVSLAAVWLAHAKRVRNTLPVVALTISLIGVTIAGWQIYRINAANERAGEALQRVIDGH